MKATFAARALFTGLLIATLPAVAAEKAPQKAAVSETVKLTATVMSVNYDSRLITLQGQDGKTLTVEASPEVLADRERLRCGATGQQQDGKKRRDLHLAALSFASR